MFFILALFGAAAWLLAASPASAQPADLVVENARIYTLDPSQPEATAMAITGSRITAVGTDVSTMIGPKTRRIDAKSATIIPGLIDSHVHMAGLGELLDSFDLRHVKSVDEVAKIVKDAASKSAPGEWIQGRAWDETNWGGKFPEARDLDAAAPKNPVFLKRVDGHAAWVNSKALAAAGITKDTPDPPGGKLMRDASGNPTGVLIDRAQALVASKIPPASAAQVERRLARAGAECAKLGLTTVHDAGIGREELNAYRRLINGNRLPVRIYAMIGGSGDLWREYLEKGPEINERLTVRCIKLVADGAMGSRGAAFWQPYSDDPGNTGILILSKEQIEQVARDAVKHGFQVATHAIGDRANRTALDAYAAALEGANDKRFRIEHAQVVSLPDFALFAKYNVIASIESTHATSDMRWAAARLGPDRMQGAWATKRFLKSGVRITNGSDTPVENPNPLWGFYAAVTRQDHQGNPPGGFMPDQKLTREEALRSWTIGGAYAAFEETQKGSLEPGKLADFIMLSQDIMKTPEPEILKTRVTMTVLGGQTVYSEGR
jgi:predicted amidohydrolase YtcJ